MAAGLSAARDHPWLYARLHNRPRFQICVQVGSAVVRISKTRSPPETAINPSFLFLQLDFENGYYSITTTLLRCLPIQEPSNPKQSGS